jgi:ribosomal protein L37E
MQLTFDALIKIAYDLDRKGKYTEADKIDALIKSLQQRVGISVIDDIISLSHDLIGAGEEIQAKQLIDSIIKNAACPQCGNHEFANKNDIVCEDCGYPYVKEERDPSVKHITKIPSIEDKSLENTYIPAEVEVDLSYEDEVARLVALAKQRAMNPNKDEDITVRPQDTNLEEVAEYLWETGGFIWWCTKCNLLSSPNRPCDCMRNEFDIKGETAMFKKLVRLANELDKMGKHDEASLIDDVLRAVGAEEIDPLDLEMKENLDVPVVKPLAGPINKEDEMRIELEMLRQENEALKLKKLRSKPSGGIKVSPKGAVSVYGLGRWPVTLYQGQWAKLLDMREKILQFIQENKEHLTTKEE